jgi:hypothetical protein
MILTVKKLFPLVALISMPFAARADVSLGAHRAALKQALEEVARGPHGAVEAASLRLTLAKFAALGVRPGPLSIELAGVAKTREELGYRPSESFDLGPLRGIAKAGIYTSIAQARLPDANANARFRAAIPAGVDPLAVLLSLEVKERLETAYLASFTRTHALPAPRRDGSLDCSSHWEIDGQGCLVAVEACYGQGD